MTSASAIWRQEIKHPALWLMIAGIVGIATAGILWRVEPGWHFSKAPAPSLEEVVWTCDPSYQVFFAPGTPESLAVVRRLQSAWKTDRSLQEVSSFPHPVLVSLSAGSSKEIAVFSPFSPQAAAALRASHGRSASE